MARRHRKHNRTTSKRRERRRRALNETAASPIPPAVVSGTAGDPVDHARRAAPARPRDGGLSPVREDDGRTDRRWGWVLLPIGGLLVLAAILAGQWLDTPRGAAGGPTPEPSIVLGEIGGAVFSPAPTASPAQPTTPPTPEASPPPTPHPTPVEVATPAPTPVRTPAPATPVPATPVPATPEPTAIVVAAADPADAVALFYRHAVDEAFDAAYAMWSERMKQGFPREENLDGRFDETAAITFNQLRTVAEDAGRAVVQTNFVEEYESGATREFIGYWEVVLVEGQWLLDQPHY